MLVFRGLFGRINKSASFLNTKVEPGAFLEIMRWVQPKLDEETDSNLHSLKLTATFAPENGWERKTFAFTFGARAFAVTFRVCN